MLNPYASFSGFDINVPQLFADVDRTRAQQLGVSIPDVFDTLQDFPRFDLRERLQ